MFDQHRYPALLNQYHGVIIHVLNRWHVDRYKPYFDDLYQLAQIALYQSAEDFDGDPLAENNHYRFTAYAKRMINWRVLDELRKTYQMGSQELATTEDWVFEMAGGDEPAIRVTADVQRFLDEAAKLLSKKDMDFLYHVIQSQGKMKLLLDLYPISRQAIYNKKLKLAHKLAAIRHILVD